MQSFWKFFLTKRSFTYLLMVSLILVGTISVFKIPKESAPEVVIPLGIVTTTLKGANAEDTEKLLTNKLEEEIKNAQNISKVTSSSREGVSIITAEFEASANVEISIQNLKDAVDRAKPKLPLDATEPVITKVNFADQPILIISISQDLPAPKLTELGKTLETELKKVSGVSKVVISGTRDKEVSVIIKNEALTQYGVTTSQIVQAIASANSSIPVGSINTGNIDYPLKFSASLENRDDIPNIFITSLSGSPVYLRDVATVYDGLEPPKSLSRVSTFGKPSENALTLSVYKKSGGDLTKIADGVKAKINELKSTILEGAQVVTTIDNGNKVSKDLRELTRTGLETVALVMLMLFLTIGWREALVAGLSIPLSFVIAFIGLYISGNTINFISLFSLILAIGILVDSGIVVAEGIHTRIKKYGNAEEAALATIKEYSWPLIAGTMTTVAVFAPLFFLSGVVGQFISSIPFTIIFVLLASIVVALGMVPLLAVLLTKEPGEKVSKFEELQEKISDIAKKKYETLLHSLLSNDKREKLFLGLLFSSFFLIFFLPGLGIIKVKFFPQDNQDFVYIGIERGQGTPLAETDLTVREVEEVLYASTVPDSFVTTVGGSSAFSSSGSESGSKYANITVVLKKNRTFTSTEAVEILQKELSAVKSAKITVEQGNNGPPSGAPISLVFTSDSLSDLSKAVSSGEDLLKTIHGAADVTSSMKDNGNQFDLTFDRLRAASYGMSAAQIASALRTSVAGVVATTLSTNGDDIDIVVKSNLNTSYENPEDTNITTLDSIKQLPISTPTGTILLGSFISEKLTESLTSIAHKNGKRQGTVSSNLTKDTTAVEVVQEFKKRETELHLPPDVSISYGGENEDVNKTFSEMIIALALGMTLMLGILVIEFNSVRYSLYLLVAIPLSLIGIFLGLAVSRQALSFSSMLGIIALAGVIINHAIILLDSVLHNLEAEKEKAKHERRSLKDVIVSSASLRLRPIFLTTITTVIGMIPLTTISALWGPLAFTIMFGLSFSMILTLILIPVLFYRYPGKKYREMKI